MNFCKIKENKRHRRTLITINTNCTQTAQITDTAKWLRSRKRICVLLTGQNRTILWLIDYKTLPINPQSQKLHSIPYHPDFPSTHHNTKYICSAQSKNRYKSRIVLRNVGILTLRNTILELLLRKVRIGTKWESHFISFIYCTK